MYSEEKGECRAEWQVVGEQWESHWLTGWKLNTGLQSCLTVGVSLLPWGRDPVYWPSWYPSPATITACYTWIFLGSSKVLKRWPCVIDLNVHSCSQRATVFSFSDLLCRVQLWLWAFLKLKLPIVSISFLIPSQRASSPSYLPSVISPTESTSIACPVIRKGHPQLSF